MGFGIINFLLAIPAVYTIDTFGRRSLLLATFPFMALFHLVTGLGFLFKERTKRKIAVMVGMCKFYYIHVSSDLAGTHETLSVDLFSVAYSPGEGPVPFV